MENQTKKRIFSGVQPSGKLTLGNYLGALKNWSELQDEYDCIYSVMNMHAISVRQVPAELRRQTFEIFAQYLACGIDPKKSIMFVQSHVPEHAELMWTLNCYTMFGELSRMTQFKDKSLRHADNINAGLFTYPVLMAADILLYDTDIVPVGHDQLQHVEITRDIAVRMNGIYENMFTVPEAFIPKVGARIMSLQDPEKKMSKSDPNVNAFILLTDTKDDIMRKFKRAVTDSGARVCRGEDKKAIENLMGIYSAVTGLTAEQIEVEFEGKGYGEFKTAVGEAVAQTVDPIRQKTEDFLKNKDYLEGLMREGAERAEQIARRTLRRVYKKIGFAQV